MNHPGPSDGARGGDRTSVETAAPDKGPPTFEPDEMEPPGPITDEPTMQGASFLVERITPVPPTRGAVQKAPAAAAHMSDSPGPRFGMDVSPDMPTAAVQNPGPRPPQAMAQRPTQAMPTGTLRVDPSSVARMEPMTPMSRPQGDVSPNVETAYVPLPGQPGVPIPAAGVPQTAMVGVVQKAQGQVNKLSLASLAERIKGSKNARLAIIAGCGILSVAVTLVVFSPRQKGDVTPTSAVEAVPQPQVEQKPPDNKPPDNADPSKVEEKDILLEKAVLAVEAGRTDEALAIFRRYTEEESNPAAEFMVQFLQMQISQTGKER